MIEKYKRAFDIIKSPGKGVTRDEYEEALSIHTTHVELLESFYQLATSEDFWTHDEMKQYEQIRIKLS